MMLMFGSISKFSNQGVEKLNDRAKKAYLGQINR